MSADHDARCTPRDHSARYDFCIARDQHGSRDLSVTLALVRGLVLPVWYPAGGSTLEGQRGGKIQCPHASDLPCDLLRSLGARSLLSPFSEAEKSAPATSAR